MGFEDVHVEVGESGRGLHVLLERTGPAPRREAIDERAFRSRVPHVDALAIECHGVEVDLSGTHWLARVGGARHSMSSITTGGRTLAVE